MSDAKIHNSATGSAAEETRKVDCPNCGKRFNCIKPSTNCWCMKVERKFDYKKMLIEKGVMSCVCPICLTGKNK